jgi:hypothetical protein
VLLVIEEEVAEEEGLPALRAALRALAAASALCPSVLRIVTLLVVRWCPLPLRRLAAVEVEAPSEVLLDAVRLCTEADLAAAEVREEEEEERPVLALRVARGRM